MATFRSNACTYSLPEVDNFFTDDYMAPYPCFTEGSASLPVVLIKSKDDSNIVRNALIADPNMEISVYSTGENLVYDEV